MNTPTPTPKKAKNNPLMECNIKNPDKLSTYLSGKGKQTDVKQTAPLEQCAIQTSAT
ncbi:hypothetical protein OCU04_012654 [Sclerotinia nivalis]|uniref:Uncharacterized protein n=1 Tax=Sclerotinia nivalis TaxID=352851 RepID=A0A9X0A965_9HELO|nr:hypothetical protein OCU04_012654 [Sclerotinia nivalis]